MKTALVILLLIPLCMALTVEKIVESPNSQELKKEIKVLLQITNPYGQEVPIKIQSRDVAGGSGFDIECYEMTLSPDAQQMLQLNTFVPNYGGDFTLGIANISFVNPITGQQDHTVSNELNITVKGEGDKNTESITTVYQCDGMNMQSTQTKSSNQQQQEQQQEQQQTQEEQQQQMDQKLQKNQMNQDSQSLKKQLQEEMQEQQKAQEQLEQALDQNQELQEKKQEMEEQGYEQTGKEINAQDNNSGEFEYQYKNEQGQSAKVQGEMQEGKMKELSSSRSMDEQALQEMLEQDEEFQELAQDLQQQGFNQTEFSYSEKDGQTSTATSYENQEGQQLNITAKIQNETVTDVQLEDGKRNNYWWLAIGLLAVGAMLMFLMKKKPEEIIENRPPFDYTAHAQKMLKEAEKLFANQEYKEAYGRASEALRLYYSYRHGDAIEITATETIKLLKSKSMPYENARKALNLCGMVEFAKYQPNHKDFSAIINAARIEIS